MDRTSITFCGRNYVAFTVGGVEFLTCAGSMRDGAREVACVELLVRQGPSLNLVGRYRSKEERERLVEEYLRMIRPA